MQFVAEPLPLLGDTSARVDVPYSTSWRVDHVISTLPVFANVKMSTGEARRRRVHRSAPATVALSRELSAADMHAWRLWWEGTVKSGALGFEAVISKLGEGVVVGQLFARTQPKFKPIEEGTYWQVEIQATILSTRPLGVVSLRTFHDTFSAPNGSDSTVVYPDVPLAVAGAERWRYTTLPYVVRDGGEPTGELQYLATKGVFNDGKLEGGPGHTFTSGMWVGQTSYPWPALQVYGDGNEPLFTTQPLFVLLHADGGSSPNPLVVGQTWLDLYSADYNQLIDLKVRTNSTYYMEVYTYDPLTEAEVDVFFEGSSGGPHKLGIFLDSSGVTFIVDGAVVGTGPAVPGLTFSSIELGGFGPGLASSEGGYLNAESGAYISEVMVSNTVDLAQAITLTQDPGFPRPLIHETFTAANDTPVHGKEPNVHPDIDGLRAWVDYYLSGGLSASAIVANAVGQTTNLDRRYAQSSLALYPSVGYPSAPSTISTVFVLKVTFDAQRAPVGNFGFDADAYEEEDQITFSLGTGYTDSPYLKLRFNGAFEFGTPDLAFTGPAIGGGTFTFVAYRRYRSGNNVTRFYANGAFLGEVPSLETSSNTPGIASMLGLFWTVHPTELTVYLDLSDAQVLTLVGAAVTPTPIPPPATPPANLTLLVKDTFTAADGTDPTSRMPDTTVTNLFEGGGWNYVGGGEAFIEGNRLRYTPTVSQYLSMMVESDRRQWSDLIPCFPVTLYLHGRTAAGAPASNGPVIYCSLGLYGTYFSLDMWPNNTYQAAVAGYEWESDYYFSTNGARPSLGAGAHKLALFYDGTHAYLIADGVLRETSPDISSRVVDPRECIGFAIEIGNPGGSADTYVEETALYYGGTLAQAIALTA